MKKLLLLLLLIALFCAAYPMYVIRPFRVQGPTELALALAVRGWGPWVAWACVAGGVYILSTRRIHKAAWVLPVLTAGFAAATHFNIFERMFNPMGTPGSLSIAEAKVDGDDMILAVTLNNAARAYPIRMMGYHHIANDLLAGSPIVVTY